MPMMPYHRGSGPVKVIWLAEGLDQAAARLVEGVKMTSWTLPASRWQPTTSYDHSLQVPLVAGASRFKYKSFFLQVVAGARRCALF